MGGNGPDERRGDAGRPATGAAARPALVASARPGSPTVADAASELYGATPEAFTERRQALATAAKEAGDKPAAAAIAALRKPTRAAWVVNRLARADPDAPARLAALAAALRDAEQRKDGLRLRELSAERGSLIDALTAVALAAADVADPPTSLREEVAATLTAALADPETAAEFAAGTLTKAAHWSGFGFGGFDGFGGLGLSPTSEEPAAGRRDLPRQPRRPAARRAASRRDDGPPDEIGARRAAQERRTAEERQAAEERRLAEQEQRLAREEAERAAERQKNYEDAERSVASAATATIEAGSAEERLEAEVRDLEERLIQARADLAKARLRARHAESAERRARQTLDRLPRP